ncbi:MAG: cytosine permease [Alicyclobacillus sp.]|nr:cytosine permease [Alicyclobacillus sp.]
MRDSAEGYQGIEQRSYEFIPLSERHGAPKQLFFMWFGVNAQVFALVTGAIGISLGLNFWWTALAVLIGNAIGSLFMALHSAQGPKLGLPQMIQSRAQFGYYGAILPLLMVWVMYIAFAATDIVLAGQGFNAAFHLNLNTAMVVVTIPMVLLALYGYNWIHRLLRYATWGYVAFFVFLTVFMFIHGVTPSQLNHGSFTIGNFLLAVSIFATWQISYAPYVSDYSRYMHPSLAHRTFWGTYLGTTISAVWLMILGAAIAALAPANSTMSEIQSLGGPIGGSIMTVLLAIGLIAPNSTNVYGGVITTLSIANNFIKFQSSAGLRLGVSVIFGLLSVLVATVGAGNFMNNLENYMVILLYFMIPWTAINLTDFYFIHRGQYNTDDFFTKTGPFGRYRWKPLLVYLIGFLVEVPFMNTSVYQGPLSKAMGGADIAWIVGLVIVFPLYYWLCKADVTRETKFTAVSTGI